MTPKEASFIHEMRVVREYTWRKIAEEWAKKYDESDTSQQRGRELCEEASKILGIEVE